MNERARMSRYLSPEEEEELLRLLAEPYEYPSDWAQEWKRVFASYLRERIPCCGLSREAACATLGIAPGQLDDILGGRVEGFSPSDLEILAYRIDGIELTATEDLARSVATPN